MDTGAETSMPLNEKAVKFLSARHEEIMDSLLDLRDKSPEEAVIQEIESLGGVGTIGMTLELIEEMLEPQTREPSAGNAQFVVAMLQSMAIRNYLADFSKGDLKSMDLEELRDYFLDQI